MEKGICIISGNEGTGYPVKDDAVILSLRRIKRFLGIAKNNRLIVGAEMLDEYKKRRSKFEKNFVQYVALAVIIFAAMAVLSILAGTISLGTFLMPVLIGALLVLLSLTSYIPAIEGAKPEGAAAAPQDLQKPLGGIPALASRLSDAISTPRKHTAPKGRAKKKR